MSTLMSDESLSQAMAWRIRLDGAGSDRPTLLSFAAWRARPGNAEAYAFVDRAAKARASRLR